MIGRFSRSMAAAEEKGETHGQDAVTDGTRVGPRAGEQEEEQLQVRQEENRCPYPDRKWWQVGSNALIQAADGGRRRGARPHTPHVFQAEPLNIKHIVCHQHAEQ